MDNVQGEAKVKYASIPKEHIQFDDVDDLYIVKSPTQADVHYVVDMGLGVCTCTKESNEWG